MKPLAIAAIIVIALMGTGFLAGFTLGAEGAPARECSPNAQLQAIQQRIEKVESVLVQHWGKP